jgi:hypothetical protein
MRYIRENRESRLDNENDTALLFHLSSLIQRDTDKDIK